MILALNETRKTLIASRLQKSRSRKSKPAPHESAISSGGGLWVEGCHQVDTSGMRAPVDLLFLDADSRVIESMNEVRPDSVTAEIADAVAVLELPAGTVRFSQTEKGDRLTLEVVRAEVNGPDMLRGSVGRRTRNGDSVGRSSGLF